MRAKKARGKVWEVGSLRAQVVPIASCRLTYVFVSCNCYSRCRWMPDLNGWKGWVSQRVSFVIG